MAVIVALSKCIKREILISRKDRIIGETLKKCRMRVFPKVYLNSALSMELPRRSNSDRSQHTNTLKERGKQKIRPQN